MGERAPGRWVRGLQAGIKRGCESALGGNKAGVRGLQAGKKRGCGGCLGAKGERCGCPGEKPGEKEGVQLSARRAGACGSPD